MAEILDIYDENMVKLGTKDRDAVHRDGDWHRVFHCWIIYRGQDSDYMVVQYRAPDKQFYPNCFDLSAGGHYAAGETSRDGIREIREELGIDVAYEDLIPLGIRYSASRFENLLDYEIADVFLLICDKPISEYAVQPEEVSGLAVFEIDDAIQMFTGQQDSIRASAVGLGHDVIDIRPEDFVPTNDAYLYKVLLLAKQYLNGAREHLVI